MGKLQIIVLFAIIILFSGSVMLLIPNVDAKKSTGTYNTEISSNKVCGDKLCSESHFLSRGPSDQQSKFSVGGVIQQSMSREIMPSDGVVPDWIKHNAGWWANGSIDDDSFIQGIQFLIKEGILSVSVTELAPVDNNEIPDWIKNNAGWWNDGTTTENDFLNGIEYLVKNGIIHVN